MSHVYLHFVRVTTALHRKRKVEEDYSQPHISAIRANKANKNAHIDFEEIDLSAPMEMIPANQAYNVPTVQDRAEGPYMPGGRFVATQAYKRKAYKRLSGKRTYKRRKRSTYRKSYGRTTRGGNGGNIIIGRGDYTSFGGMLGAKAGGYLGDMAQNALMGLVTGLGDYTVQKNAFLNGRLPEMVNISDSGGIVVRYQEYLFDVVTSATIGAFSTQAVDINAANPLCFPFLAQLAANFEQYEIQGLIFEFRSTSADALNSTNTALGSVMLATQYDVLDPLFTSKYEMLNYEFANSIKPAGNCLHMVECARSQTSISDLYTAWNGQVAVGSDPRLYNLGRFVIACTGFQAASVNVGEVHITYQVRLLKPKLFGGLGNNISYAKFVIPTWSNAKPIGTAAPSATVTNQPLITLDQTNREIIFPNTTGKLSYSVMIWWESGGANTAFTAPIITAFNCAVNGGGVIPAPLNGDTVYAAMLWFQLTTDGSGLAPYVLVGTGGALPGTSGGSTQTQMWIVVEQKANI